MTARKFVVDFDQILLVVVWLARRVAITTQIQTITDVVIIWRRHDVEQFREVNVVHSQSSRIYRQQINRAERHKRTPISIDVCDGVGALCVVPEDPFPHLVGIDLTILYEPLPLPLPFDSPEPERSIF